MTKLTFCRYSLLSLISLIVFAANADSQDEKLKAIFIYNFTKYVNWPAKGGNFIITVLGSSEITNELKGIAAKKQVGNSAIEIKSTASPADIAQCHILYITAAKTNTLPQLLNYIKNNKILVITEKPNSCQSGSGINFVTKEGKLAFEISKGNIENCGLNVSSELLTMGTVVVN